MARRDGLLRHSLDSLRGGTAPALLVRPERQAAPGTAPADVRHWVDWSFCRAPGRGSVSPLDADSGNDPQALSAVGQPVQVYGRRAEPGYLAVAGAQVVHMDGDAVRIACDGDGDRAMRLSRVGVLERVCDQFADGQPRIGCSGSPGAAQRLSPAPRGGHLLGAARKHPRRYGHVTVSAPGQAARGITIHRSAHRWSPSWRERGAACGTAIVT